MQLFTASYMDLKSYRYRMKKANRSRMGKAKQKPDLGSCLSQYAQHAPEIKSDQLCLF